MQGSRQAKWSRALVVMLLLGLLSDNIFRWGRQQLLKCLLLLLLLLMLSVLVAQVLVETARGQLRRR